VVESQKVLSNTTREEEAGKGRKTRRKEGGREGKIRKEKRTTRQDKTRYNTRKN
jgi:hypothetical protein